MNVNDQELLRSRNEWRLAAVTFFIGLVVIVATCVWLKVEVQ